MNDPLTWSELAELYDERNPSGAARTLPMNTVFEWAKKQPDIDLQDDGTLTMRTALEGGDDERHD